MVVASDCGCEVSCSPHSVFGASGSCRGCTAAFRRRLRRRKLRRGRSARGLLELLRPPPLSRDVLLRYRHRVVLLPRLPLAAAPLPEAPAVSLASPSAPRSSAASADRGVQRVQQPQREMTINEFLEAASAVRTRLPHVASTDTCSASPQPSLLMLCDEPKKSIPYTVMHDMGHANGATLQQLAAAGASVNEGVLAAAFLRRHRQLLCAAAFPLFDHAKVLRFVLNRLINIDKFIAAEEDPGGGAPTLCLTPSGRCTFGDG